MLCHELEELVDVGLTVVSRALGHTLSRERALGQLQPLLDEPPVLLKALEGPHEVDEQ